VKCDMPLGALKMAVARQNGPLALLIGAPADPHARRGGGV
jgi:hypothetical protein